MNISNVSSVKLVRHFEMPMDILLVGTITYSIIFFIGVIGNLVTIRVLTRKNFTNFTNFLLANLSIADLMTVLICVPTGLHDLYAKERWYLGETMCYLVLFFENCFGIASILTILCISLERYYVICKPLIAKSIISHSRTLKLIILIWVTAILVNIPLIYMSEHKLKTFHDKTTSYKCIANTVSQTRQWYSFFLTFVVYLIIGGALIFIYHKITKHLNNSLQVISNIKQNSGSKSLVDPCLPSGINMDDKNKLERTAVVEVNESEAKIIENCKSSKEDTVQISTNTNWTKYIKPRKKIIIILKIVILVFYLTLFPLKLWNIILMLFSHKVAFRRVIKLREYWYINIIMRDFFYMNSSVNPILFNILSAKFRAGCRSLFGSSVSIKQKFSIRRDSPQFTSEQFTRGPISTQI